MGSGEMFFCAHLFVTIGLKWAVHWWQVFFTRVCLDPRVPRATRKWVRSDKCLKRKCPATVTWHSAKATVKDFESR